MHHGQRHPGGERSKPRAGSANGGLSEHVAALTINKVAVGIESRDAGGAGHATGDIDIAVAGGMES
jgi:hypothetical protein